VKIKSKAKKQRKEVPRKSTKIRVFETSIFFYLYFFISVRGVRRLVKQNLTKQIVITYSPEVFRVKQVIIPRRRTLARRRYVVENSRGLPIYKPNGGIKHFFASELQLVAEDEDNEPEISMERALKLNPPEMIWNIKRKKVLNKVGSW
jgi:hypothetical protein